MAAPPARARADYDYLIKLLLIGDSVNSNEQSLASPTSDQEEILQSSFAAAAVVWVRVAFFYVSQMVPLPLVSSLPLGLYSLNIGVELQHLVLGSSRILPIYNATLLFAGLILRLEPLNLMVNGSSCKFGILLVRSGSEQSQLLELSLRSMLLTNPIVCRSKWDLGRRTTEGTAEVDQEQEFRIIFLTLTLGAYYRGAMGILLVYDVTDESSFNNIRNWIRNIEQHASDNVNKILVGNKADMDESKRAVPTSKGQALADEYGIKFFETSAKTNLNVEQVFFSIARDIKQRLADTDSRAETRQLELAKLPKDQLAVALKNQFERGHVMEFTLCLETEKEKEKN
uniref:Uncharacterized protein n=1 Tax=Fagus sylvatica TaxID=28930 RepID=A0A2N9GY96_FAGSY